MFTSSTQRTKLWFQPYLILFCLLHATSYKWTAITGLEFSWAFRFPFGVLHIPVAWTFVFITIRPRWNTLAFLATYSTVLQAPIFVTSFWAPKSALGAAELLKEGRTIEVSWFLNQNHSWNEQCLKWQNSVSPDPAKQVCWKIERPMSASKTNMAAFIFIWNRLETVKTLMTLMENVEEECGEREACREWQFIGWWNGMMRRIVGECEFVLEKTDSSWQTVSGGILSVPKIWWSYVIPSHWSND